MRSSPHFFPLPLFFSSRSIPSPRISRQYRPCVGYSWCVYAMAKSCAHHLHRRVQLLNHTMTLSGRRRDSAPVYFYYCAHPKTVTIHSSAHGPSRIHVRIMRENTYERSHLLACARAHSVIMVQEAKTKFLIASRSSLNSSRHSWSTIEASDLRQQEYRSVLPELIWQIHSTSFRMIWRSSGAREAHHVVLCPSAEESSRDADSTFGTAFIIHYLHPILSDSIENLLQAPHNLNLT